jgi:hypothetical protein
VLRLRKDDARGGIELALDDIVVTVPGSDLSVPPHVPAADPERAADLTGVLAVLAGVTEKHVAQVHPLAFLRGVFGLLIWRTTTLGGLFSSIRDTR